MTESKKTPELRFPGFKEPWEEKKLGEILEFKNGLNKGKKYFGYGTPIVNYMDVNRNKLLERKDIEGLVNVNKSELDRFKVIKGDVFFTRTSETIEEIGLASVIIEDIDNCVYSGFVLRGRNITNNMDNKFSGYFYNTERIRKEIMRKSSKTTRALTNVAILSEVKAIIPTKKEQEKIGSFFSSLDKKLDLQKDRLEELKSYKKGMMQRIFDQEIRFKDENGRNYPDWEEKRLGESIINIVDKVQNQNIPILSSTSKGMFLQSEYFKKSVASKDISDYKVVKKGDFTYRSMSDTGEFYFNIQNIVDIGAVSPAYPVFNFKDNINNTWFYYFINNSNSIKRQLLGIFQGGTRFALSISKFSLLKINLPSLAEQEKIASFLSALDRKIELEEEKLRSYEEFKKGLMQRMFV